jgi:hypothetical protein
VTAASPEQRSREPPWTFPVFLVCFFAAWTLRATVLYRIDETLHPDVVRPLYSLAVKALLWVLPYNTIADSGVGLLRLAPSDGWIVWKARCQGIGTKHSKYWHYVYVEVRGDRLVVVSQGANGHFVEALDLASGKNLARWRFDP